jgi:hypothetical protein
MHTPASSSYFLKTASVCLKRLTTSSTVISGRIVFSFPDTLGCLQSLLLFPEHIRQGVADMMMDDLPPKLLHHVGPVQPKGARDVPLETGHADPHVAGIPPILKERGKYPD